MSEIKKSDPTLADLVRRMEPVEKSLLFWGDDYHKPLGQPSKLRRMVRWLYRKLFTFDGIDAHRSSL